jgi:glycine/D-amino acid oxidase-like deaminating enzyme
MSIQSAECFDAIVIGAGFYGCVIALYLAQERGLKRVAIIERDCALMTRASYNNQARVHNGYHYPRSFTTAYRSRCSLPRFSKEWSDAIHDQFDHVYAIARHESRITAKQFRNFCREIAAPLEPASAEIRSLFEDRLIEDVFLVEEPAFDAQILASLLKQQLQEAGVELILHASVQAVTQAGPETLHVIFSRGGQSETAHSRYAVNCCYSGISTIAGSENLKQKLRHEITELALVQVPPQMQSLGITVMDGPFFSLMPFPAKNLHTLSHVRYTPHQSFLDRDAANPYQKLSLYNKPSRFERMQRDAQRFVPALSQVEYRESLVELKTILIQNEIDDGRPILFERDTALRGFYSIMGGKIDNVFDVLAKLDKECFIGTQGADRVSLPHVLT